MHALPHGPNGTIVWLKGKSTSIFHLSDVVSNNYGLFHCHLEHPSKNVLKKTMLHSTGLKQICIPHNEDVCKGCALGKMMQQSFSSSNTCASQAFEKIHLDFKSFPMPDYYKMNYFMSFINNHMLFA